MAYDVNSYSYIGSNVREFYKDGRITDLLGLQSEI